MTDGSVRNMGLQSVKSRGKDRLIPTSKFLKICPDTQTRDPEKRASTTVYLPSYLLGTRLAFHVRGCINLSMARHLGVESAPN